MQTETLIKTIIAIAIVFIIVLAAFFILHPSVPATDTEIANTLSQAGDDFNNSNFEGAIKKAERVLRGDSKNISALLTLAFTWAQKGSLEFKEAEYGQKAIEIANEALSVDPENSEAHRIIGYANEIMEQYTEALDSYNKAIALNQNNANAFNGRGHAYDLMGEFDKAKADYLKALEINPDLEQALVNIGRIYVREGEDYKAIAVFKRVLNMTKNVRFQAEINSALGTVFSNQGENAEALSYFEKAVELDQTLVVAWVGIAREKFFSIAILKDEMEIVEIVESALDDIGTALSIYPKQTSAYYWQGIILKTVGDTENAEQSFSKALEVVDSDISLMANDRQNMRDTINLEKNF